MKCINHVLEIETSAELEFYDLTPGCEHSSPHRAFGRAG